MRLHVSCPSAPWENTTQDKDEAIDIAYNLAEAVSYTHLTLPTNREV